MENSKTIQRFGGVIKEEPLSCVQDDILFPNTCVLEAESPYFGYYSHEPQMKKPQHLYCMLNGYFSFETIIRATQKIRKEFKHPFNAALCNISIYDHTSQAIRIRDLQQYNHISNLQRMYLEEAITFKKKSIKIKNEMAMIKVRRFFLLEQVEESVFVDKEMPHHVYFHIPEQISWGFFKEITDQVKLDTCNFYFDGALSFIYDKGEIYDMIRIYRENFSISEIIELQEKYFHWLNK